MRRSLSAEWAAELLEQLPKAQAFHRHSQRVAALAGLIVRKRGQQPDLEVLTWAGIFHDLMVLVPFRQRPWGADYVSESAAMAGLYLRERQLLTAEQVALVQACIQHHHDLRPHPHPLVEGFRRADWLEVSQGLIRSGVTTEELKALYRDWPRAGFLGALSQVISRFFVRPVHFVRLFWPVRRYSVEEV